METPAGLAYPTHARSVPSRFASGASLQVFGLFLIYLMCASLTTSMLYRHQAVMPLGSLFKLSRVGEAQCLEAVRCTARAARRLCGDRFALSISVDAVSLHAIGKSALSNGDDACLLLW